MKIFKAITIFIVLAIPFIGFAQLDDLWMLDMLDETASLPSQEFYLDSLELYWSADTYTPFGYKGKSLPVNGSIVTVEADLKLTKGNPSFLKYSWFLDGVFQGAKSGYGRTSFKFGVRRTPNLHHEVLVKIFNEDNSFYVEKSIIIPITSPEIIVFQNNGNSRINLKYNNIPKNYQVFADQEVSFVALPFFFSINNIEDLEFEWSFANKQSKESSLTANLFGLKVVNKEEQEPLSTELQVKALNKKWYEQGIIKKLPVVVY